MAWIFLMIAAAFEICWAIGLKYTQGFSQLWPSVFTIVTMVFSFGFLSLAMKTLPVGTAYAVWTGTGAVGVAILGMILLGESREVARLLSIALIVAGVVGLKLFSGQSAA